MKRSICTFILCFALLTACSTQSGNSQDPQSIEEFSLHLIGNSQVEFDGNVMTVTAFGDKLENLHFVEDAIVNFYVKNTVTVGKIKDVEDILRDNKLLRLNSAQLN